MLKLEKTKIISSMSYEPREFYNTQLQVTTTQKNIIKKQRQLFLVVKLVSFLLAAVAIYYSFEGLTPLVAVVFAVVYIYALIRDQKLEQSAAFLREQIANFEAELRYLDGDITGQESGEEYLNADHPYALDLDIFGPSSLYGDIARPMTPLGADKLASYLLTPLTTQEEITARQEAICELSQQCDWLHSMRSQSKLHPIHRYSNGVIAKWANIPIISPFPTVLLYCINGVAIVSLLAAIAGLIPFILFSVLAALQLGIAAISMSRISKIAASLDAALKSLSNYLHIIRMLDGKSFDSPKLNHIKDSLFGGDGSVVALAKLRRIQSDIDSRSNLLVYIALNSLYCRDLHTIISLSKWHKQYSASIAQWVDNITELDALSSMAIYRFNHPHFSFPSVDKKSILSAKDLIHPLMRSGEAVPNDFELGSMNKLFIVTGANMAGKSTFLRSVGLNMVLAHCGCVVSSPSFSFSVVDLFTSMRTTDNLSKGSSYFHAELSRLKLLCDRAQQQRPMFVILDEMLKGTNSADKLSGSRRFLERMLEFNISGLVATHDLALGELETKYPHNFKNICFEIEHSDHNIHYSYKLQNGVSKNMNATLLLEQMGII